MSGNKYKLTEEQRELVSKNHDLIYSYAHKRNISIDEYYDVLAIGLCKAAKSFDNNKAGFSTFAYRCMENELNMLWKEGQKKSTIPNASVLSYDASATKECLDNRNSLLEVFTDYQSYSDMLYATMLLDLMKKLNLKEKKIFKFLLNDFTREEIANKIGCKRQNVDYYVQKIREKAVEYFAYN